MLWPAVMLLDLFGEPQVLTLASLLPVAQDNPLLTLDMELVCLSVPPGYRKITKPFMLEKTSKIIDSNH